VVRDVVHSGSLDRASAKRAWPAVLIEVKKLRPARASHYSDIEVDLDADGETLVLEFPSDAAFAMQMAEEPEMRDMLKLALSSVFGVTPPFRFQLGRGAVRPEGAPTSGPRPSDIDDVSPVRDAAVEPLPEYYETAIGMSEPVAQAHVVSKRVPTPGSSAGAGEPKSELERPLMHDLGGQIIGEHLAQSDNDARDTGPVADDTDNADSGQDGPGLFDTEGED
jgi:hypothetical protein